MTDDDRFDFEWDARATDEGTPDHDPGHEDGTARGDGSAGESNTARLTAVDTTTSMFDAVFDGNGDRNGGGEPAEADVERVRSIIEQGDVDHVDIDAGTELETLDPLTPEQFVQDVSDWFFPESVGEGLTDLLFSWQQGGDAVDVPGTARVLADATWRLSDYSVRAQVRTANRISDAVATASSSEELVTALFDIAEDELENAEAQLRRGIEQSGRATNRDTDRADGGDAATALPAGDRSGGDPGTPAVSSDRPTATAADPPATTDDGTAGLPDLSVSWLREAISDAPLVLGAVERAVEYAVRMQNRTVRRLWRTATAADSPDDLLAETRDIAVEEGQRLGFDLEQDITDQLSGRRALGAVDVETAERLLSERGSEVMRQSADTDYEEPVHPAYGHILQQVSVDEVRVLRLLVTEGEQPAVDVRSKGLVLGSELVAENLSMVGIEAGCRDPERTPVCLGNLDRLGLVRIVDEPLDNLKRYQILEAQPDVAEAEAEAKRSSIVYKSIQLTPLGADFCTQCLSGEAATDAVPSDRPGDTG